MNKTDVRGIVQDVRKISEKCWEVDLLLPAWKEGSPEDFAVVRMVSAALMSGPLLQRGHDVVFEDVKIGGGRAEKTGKAFNGLTAFRPCFWVHH